MNKHTSQQSASGSNPRQRQQRQFSYGSRLVVIAAAAFMLVSVAALVLFIPFIDTNDTALNTWRAEIFFLFGLLYLILTCLNAFIRTSDIIIDDTGICWVVFGKEKNKISWKDIRRIRVWNTFDYANFGPPINGYSLDTTLKYRLPYSSNPPFVFNDRVNRFPELIEIVNSYIGKYGIPIIDKRVKPPQALTRL
jgi:hypothetical protein